MFKSFEIFRKSMSKSFLTSKAFVRRSVNFDIKNELWIRRKLKPSRSKKYVRIWITTSTRSEFIINLSSRFRSKKRSIHIRDRWSERHNWSWSRNFFYTTIFWRMNRMSKRFSWFCSSSKARCDWESNFRVS